MRCFWPMCAPASGSARASASPTPTTGGIHYVQTLHRAEGGPPSPPMSASACMSIWRAGGARRMPAEAQAKARALADAHRELDWPVSPRRRIRFRPPRDAAGR